MMLINLINRRSSYNLETSHVTNRYLLPSLKSVKNVEPQNIIFSKNKHNECATKIQSLFRGHRVRLKIKPSNLYGQKILNAKNGTRYYFDEEKGTVLPRPTQQVSSGEKGAEKQVKWIYPKKYNFFKWLLSFIKPKKQDYKNNQNYSDSIPYELKELKTIIFGKQVEGDLIIIRDAGKTLDNLSKNNEKVKLKAFLPLMEDISVCHKANLFFMDIKPDNMGFGKDGIVRMFDAENICKNGLTRYFTTSGRCSSLLMTGIEFLQKTVVWSRSQDNIPQDVKEYEQTLLRRFCKTHDKYTLLLSIIELNTDNKKLHNLIRSNTKDPYSGILNKKNEYLFREWINQSVLKGYREEIYSLLKNPHDYALDNKKSNLDFSCVLNY